MTAVAAQAVMAEPKFYVRLAGEATFDLRRVRGRDLRGKLLAVVRQYDAEVRPLPWHLEEVGHLWDAGCSNDTHDLSFGHQTSDFVGALRRAELEARTDHAARSALPGLQRMSAGKPDLDCSGEEHRGEHRQENEDRYDTEHLAADEAACDRAGAHDQHEDVVSAGHGKAPIPTVARETDEHGRQADRQREAARELEVDAL